MTWEITEAYEKMPPHEQRKFQALLSQKDTLSGAAGSSSGAPHSSHTTGLFEHLDDDELGGLEWSDAEAHATAAELHQASRDRTMGG